MVVDTYNNVVVNLMCMDIVVRVACVAEAVNNTCSVGSSVAFTTCS